MSIWLKLDTNDSIYEGNALRMDWTEIIKPYQLDYIMGNPPFIGLSSLPTKDKKLKAEQQADMNLVFGNLEKKGKLDYVCAWYEKSLKYMTNTSIQAAFVSTDSITQGEQVGILWKHLKKDYSVQIRFAYQSFIWDNEAKNKANVYCVIIGFTRDNVTGPSIIYDKNNEPTLAHNINGYLIDYPDTYLKSRKRTVPYGLPEMHKGSQPTDGGGLTLSDAEATSLLKKYPQLSKVIRPYYGSNELIKGSKRYCLWLVGVEPSLYSNIPEIKQRLARVVQARRNSTTEDVRLVQVKTPQLFTQNRQPDSDYLAVPEVSKSTYEYLPISFMSKNIIASNKLYLIQTTKRWLFAILISSLHLVWLQTVAGRRGTGFSYSPSVYTNFPWINFSENDKAALNETAEAILRARNKYADSTLADLYDQLTMPPELRKAHEKNDKLVRKLYGLNPNAGESEMLQHLFQMRAEKNK